MSPDPRLKLSIETTIAYKFYINELKTPQLFLYKVAKIQTIVKFH